MFENGEENRNNNIDHLVDILKNPLVQKVLASSTLFTGAIVGIISFFLIDSVRPTTSEVKPYRSFLITKETITDEICSSPQSIKEAREEAGRRGMIKKDQDNITFLRAEIVPDPNIWPVFHWKCIFKGLSEENKDKNHWGFNLKGSTPSGREFPIGINLPTYCNKYKGYEAYYETNTDPYSWQCIQVD